MGVVVLYAHPHTRDDHTPGPAWWQAASAMGGDFLPSLINMDPNDQQYYSEQDVTAQNLTWDDMAQLFTVLKRPGKSSLYSPCAGADDDDDDPRATSDLDSQASYQFANTTLLSTANEEDDMVQGMSTGYTAMDEASTITTPPSFPHTIPELFSKETLKDFGIKDLTPLDVTWDITETNGTSAPICWTTEISMITTKLFNELFPLAQTIPSSRAPGGLHSVPIKPTIADLTNSEHPTLAANDESLKDYLKTLKVKTSVFRTLSHLIDGSNLFDLGVTIRHRLITDLSLNIFIVRSVKEPDKVRNVYILQNNSAYICNEDGTCGVWFDPHQTHIYRFHCQPVNLQSLRDCDRHLTSLMLFTLLHPSWRFCRTDPPPPEPEPLPEERPPITFDMGPDGTSPILLIPPASVVPSVPQRPHSYEGVIPPKTKPSRPSGYVFRKLKRNPSRVDRTNPECTQSAPSLASSSGAILHGNGNRPLSTASAPDIGGKIGGSNPPSPTSLSEGSVMSMGLNSDLRSGDDVSYPGDAHHRQSHRGSHTSIPSPEILIIGSKDSLRDSQTSLECRTSNSNRRGRFQSFKDYCHHSLRRAGSHLRMRSSTDDLSRSQAEIAERRPHSGSLIHTAKPSQKEPDNRRWSFGAGDARIGGDELSVQSEKKASKRGVLKKWRSAILGQGESGTAGKSETKPSHLSDIRTRVRAALTAF